METYIRSTEKECQRLASEGLYDLLEKLTHGSNLRQRALICTPCGGNYGGVAYWLIVVNGSPPRGAILFGGHFHDPSDIFFISSGGRSRRLGREQCRIVRKFVNCFLRDKDHFNDDRRVTIQVKADGTAVEKNPLC